MKLSQLQTRTLPLRTEGDVCDLLNTRPDALGCYHPVPRPHTLSESARRILGLDRRGDVENVISVDTELGALYLEGVIDRYDGYTERSEMLASDVGDVRQIARCGDYLVARRADATLYFLRWSEAEADYTPMGVMPADISFTVERVQLAPMTFTIPACDWGVKADDLRVSIPDTARRRCADVVKRAWDDALDSCLSAGYLLQPTTVRLMARLWDGSVFCVSEPVRVPDADWQGYDRFLLPVVFSSDGSATGTADATFTLNPYRIKVSVDGPEQSLWNDVFRCIEFYAEPERSPLSASEYDVSYVLSSSAMSIFMPVHPRRDMEARLATGPWRMAVATPLPAAGDLEFGCPEGKTLEVMETQQALTGEADVMLSHGVFLHIARGSNLLTTEASNPLAAVSSTGFGSRIKAMCAMPGAGGAYTRQYIYVCTESSIFALTCDAQGHHTNCRPVSPQVLTDPLRILSADDAVYALCDSGALLRLRSARAETLYRGLPPFVALQWDGTANELWLMGGCSLELRQTSSTSLSEAQLGSCTPQAEAQLASFSLVLQLGAPWLAYRRDISVAYAVAQCGRVLGVDSDGVFFQARSYVGYDTFEADAEPASMTMYLNAPAERRLHLSGATMAPSAFDITLRAESEMLMLTTSRIDTDADALHPVVDSVTQYEHHGRRHFLLPFIGPCRPVRYLLTFAGRWSILETPRLGGAASKLHQNPKSKKIGGCNFKLHPRKSDIM